MLATATDSDRTLEYLAFATQHRQSHCHNSSQMIPTTNACHKKISDFNQLRSAVSNLFARRGKWTIFKEFLGQINQFYPLDGLACPTQTNSPVHISPAMIREKTEILSDILND